MIKRQTFNSLNNELTISKFNEFRAFGRFNVINNLLFDLSNKTESLHMAFDENRRIGETFLINERESIIVFI